MPSRNRFALVSPPALDPCAREPGSRRDRGHTLDDALRLACEGDSEAAGRVCHELRERMVAIARRSLGPIFAIDAEDIVDELFVDMLEGNLELSSHAGRSVPMLLRMTASRARRRMLERASEWERRHLDDGWLDG